MRGRTLSGFVKHSRTRYRRVHASRIVDIEHAHARDARVPFFVGKSTQHANIHCLCDDGGDVAWLYRADISNVRNPGAALLFRTLSGRYIAGNTRHGPNLGSQSKKTRVALAK